MRKLLVLLVALVTVAAFAAVNFSGSFSVTPTLTYQATPTSSITFSVPVSGSFSITGSNSDQTTGLSVSIRLGSGPAWTFTGRIWHKLYVTDPLTITLRVGNDTYPEYVASIFNIKLAPISNDLELYIVPDATSVVDFHLSNTFTFDFLTVGLTIEQLLDFDSHKTFDLSAGLNLAKALALTDVTTLSVSFTGGIDLDDPSMPLKRWTVGATFGIGDINGNVSFDNTNKLNVGLSIKVDILTVGTSIDAKVTDLMGTLNAEGYASWTTGVISNRASVKWEAGPQKLTAAWRLSVSF